MQSDSSTFKNAGISRGEGPRCRAIRWACSIHGLFLLTVRRLEGPLAKTLKPQAPFRSELFWIQGLPEGSRESKGPRSSSTAYSVASTAVGAKTGHNAGGIPPQPPLESKRQAVVIVSMPSLWRSRSRRREGGPDTSFRGRFVGLLAPLLFA